MPAFSGGTFKWSEVTRAIVPLTRLGYSMFCCSVLSTLLKAYVIGTRFG